MIHTLVDEGTTNKKWGGMKAEECANKLCTLDQKNPKKVKSLRVGMNLSGFDGVGGWAKSWFFIKNPRNWVIKIAREIIDDRFSLWKSVARPISMKVVPSVVHSTCLSHSKMYRALESLLTIDADYTSRQVYPRARRWSMTLSSLNRVFFFLSLQGEKSNSNPPWWSRMKRKNTFELFFYLFSFVFVAGLTQCHAEKASGVAKRSTLVMSQISFRYLSLELAHLALECDWMRCTSRPGIKTPHANKDDLSLRE